MCGSATSHSSATMTMAVALRARTIALPSGSAAAGRAREEDDSLGVARDLVERLDHLRLAPAVARRHRHRSPHALLELLAERLDEKLLVGGDLDVALGQQDLSVTGLHAQELHSS